MIIKTHCENNSRHMYIYHFKKCMLIWMITGMTTAYSLEQSSSVGLRSLVGFFIRRRKILRRGQW